MPGSAAQAAGLTVAGKVIERIDAGPYSYLRLATAGGEQWAAVPKCEAKRGDQAVVVQAMTMDGFESKTLKRKFDRIVFGMLQGGSGPSANAGAGPSPHGPMPGRPMGAAPSAKPVVVAQAAAPSAAMGPIAVTRAKGAGGVTVAELYAKRGAWRDKLVRVHGKVVKVLPAILNKNWIHLRDGTGTDEKKDNDLTVTSDDTATVGQVVSVEGTAHTDRDFGSGYHYLVIVENAKVRPD